MPARALPNASRLAVALLAALSLPALAQQAGQAQSSSERVRTLDQVTVTGSRIKRADAEQALPITSITKAQIDRQGITSAEQLLMTLNVAGNGSDNLASNASIAPAELRGNNGMSGANLRGQGADATLVLLNGRRVAAHGLRGTAVDLNSIPFSAIERVEVLRDGASAIYGTDAIGGVINFITRSDYAGAEASLFADVTGAGGGNIYTANVLAGVGDLETDRWNAFATVSWKTNKILRGTDRDFSNSFQPTRGLSPDTRGTPFATVFNLAGSLMAGGFVDPKDGVRVSNANILDLPGGAGCAAGGDLMGPYDERLWLTAGIAPANRYGCAWDYPAAAVMQQPLDSVQFIGRATFAIGGSHRMYVEAMASEVEAHRMFEPNQISSSSSATAAFNPTTWYPLNAVTKPTYDKIYNALNAYFGGNNTLNYGAPIAYRWRCEACGPREIVTETKAYRFLAGLEGLIGEWDYSIGLSHASSTPKSTLGSGYHYTAGLQKALGGGLLNPFLMPGQEQTAAAMAALEAASAYGVTLYGGKSSTTTLDASVAGPLGFNLPGGAVYAAAGVDLRRERFEFDGDDYTAVPPIFNAPFDLVNTLPRATRDVKAVFAEFNLPLLDSLDLTLAGRYDHYSGFGATTNPKVSFKWQPLDALVFRGAYSTGFKVPEFAKLFSGTTETPYTGSDIADPKSCPGGVPSPAPGCDSIRPDILTGGKRDLAPEDAKQKSFGVVVEPADWFNVSVDWWEVERINTIRTPDRTTLINNYDLFEANWIRDAGGAVIAIDQRFINSGGTLTRGIELDANLRGELAGGNWTLNLNGSHIDTFKEKVLASQPYGDNRAGEYVRYYSLPIRWKHSLTFSWSRGDWTHSLGQLHRSGYKDEVPNSMGFGTYTPADWNPDVDSYTIYNYSVSWTGIDRLKATFGIRNLLDTDPPFTAHKNDWASGAGWEPRIADPRGRAFTIRLDYKFH